MPGVGAAASDQLRANTSPVSVPQLGLQSGAVPGRIPARNVLGQRSSFVPKTGDKPRFLNALALAIMKPYPDDLLDAHDVSTVVNSANYDGPECIQPISDDV